MKIKKISFILVFIMFITLILTGCILNIASVTKDEKLYIVTEDKNSSSLSNSKLTVFMENNNNELYNDNYFDGKVGYINKDGKKIINFKYDKGTEFKNGMAGVKDGDTYKIIDTSGKTLVKKNDGILIPLNDNLIKYQKLKEDNVSSDYNYDLEYGEENLNLEGILNKKGDFVIEPGRYDKIINDIGEGNILVKKDGKYGLLNKEGNEIIPCDYQKIGNINEGFIPVVKDNKFGAFNVDGELIVPIDYLYLGTMNEGVVPARLDESGIGFLDINGNWVILPYFDGVTIMNSGFAFARKGDNDFIIDKNGAEIKTDIKFKNIVSLNGFSDNGLALVNLLEDEKSSDAIINNKGEEVKAIDSDIYSNVWIDRNGLITTVDKNSKMGLINGEGKVILKNEYNNIIVINEDIILVDKEGIYYYMNSEGKILY